MCASSAHEFWYWRHASFSRRKVSGRCRHAATSSLWPDYTLPYTHGFRIASIEEDREAERAVQVDYRPSFPRETRTAGSLSSPRRNVAAPGTVRPAQSHLLFEIAVGGKTLTSSGDHCSIFSSTCNIRRTFDE